MFGEAFAGGAAVAGYLGRWGVREVVMGWDGVQVAVAQSPGLEMC